MSVESLFTFTLRRCHQNFLLHSVLIEMPKGIILLFHHARIFKTKRDVTYVGIIFCVSYKSKTL